MNTGLIQNIELVQISNSTVGTNTFTANSDSLAITVSGGSENATINLGATGTQSVTITGSGSDTVALGSGINVVNTGGGADTVTGALGTGDAVDLQAGNDNYSFNDLSTDGTVSGGAGDSDTLTIGSAGITNVTITLGDGANTTINSVDYSNFDNLAAGASDDALVVTAAAAGSSISTGSANDTITLGAGIDTVNAGNGSDTVNGVGAGDVVNLEGSDDDFTYAAVAATVDAGKTGETDGDELTITATTGSMTIDLSVVDDQQITVGGTGIYWNFNDLNAGAVGVDDALTVTAAAGGSTITTGSAADFITLGAGIDTVNSGDGADTVNSIGAGDTVNLQGGDDSASFLAGIAATIDGGETNDGPRAYATP
jgi:Ca2+-binding RTX toxin-like protein